MPMTPCDENGTPLREASSENATRSENLTEESSDTQSIRQLDAEVSQRNQSMEAFRIVVVLTLSMGFH